MLNLHEIKKELCDIGRRIYQNGFVAANDGNFSIKISENEFLCTPTGVSKGYMTTDMILRVDNNGNLLESNRFGYQPSSEFKMHLKVYEERPDVKAVVHAHPPLATAHAVVGLPLDKFIMPEAVIFLGTVPLTQYGTPSTDEIPNAISQALKDHDALLLKNHGALTVGADLMSAYFKMETLEYFAKVSYYAAQLGQIQELNCEQIEKLIEIRRNMKLPGKHPGCSKCDLKGTNECHTLSVKDNKTDNHNTSIDEKSNTNDMEALIAEITKKVMANIN